MVWRLLGTQPGRRYLGLALDGECRALLGPPRLCALTPSRPSPCCWPALSTPTLQHPAPPPHRSQPHQCCPSFMLAVNNCRSNLRPSRPAASALGPLPLPWSASSTHWGSTPSHVSLVQGSPPDSASCAGKGWLEQRAMDRRCRQEPSLLEPRARHPPRHRGDSPLLQGDLLHARPTHRRGSFGFVDLFQDLRSLPPLVLQVGPDPTSWTPLMKRSANRGATWSAPQRIKPPCLGPAKNKASPSPGSHPA